MNVLIGVDESRHARLAVQHVTRRQWPADAKFHVVSVQRGDELLKPYEDALAVLQDRFGLPAVTGERIQGDAEHVLVKLSESADLLVVGTHSHTGLARLVFGSVTDAVAEKAHCSVLVVRTSDEEKTTSPGRLSRVLVCIADDDNHKQVLQHVIDQSWAAGTEFIIVNVFEPPTEDFGPSPDRALVLFQQLEDKLRIRLDSLVSESVAFLKKGLNGHTVRGASRESLDVLNDLLKFRKREDSSLIVIGAPVHHGLFSDSVCRSIVVKAPCSVEIARHKCCR